MPSFKTIRVVLLLFVLLTVAAGAWQSRARTTSWDRALELVVFPINADGRPATSAYVGSLTAASFDSIERFMRREAQEYGIDLVTPIEVSLAPEVRSIPPQPPPDRSALATILWSLQLRYWAWRHSDYSGMRPDVRIFALYFDPQAHTRLGHSAGLQKGLVGLANVFAAEHMTEENNVILAHELLHTLGARDKYDPSTGLPLHPDGFAEPYREPLYPQSHAEIMGGRIPLAPGVADTPQSLDLALIGPATASEIRWLRR